MPCLEVHLRSIFHVDALCTTTQRPCLGVASTFHFLRWCPLRCNMDALLRVSSTFHFLRWCPLRCNMDALLKGAPTFHVLRWCPLHCNTDALLKVAPTFHVLRWCLLHYNTAALLRVSSTFHILRWCPPSFLFLCKVIGVIFNIMSAVFATNSSLGRKFSILARVSLLQNEVWGIIIGRPILCMLIHNCC